MLFPDRSVIKLRVRNGSIFYGVEASNPSEARRILALEERTGCDCPELLKRFGKEAFKKLREMFAFSLFDDVAAEFNDLKVVQTSRGFSGRFRCGLSTLGYRQMASGNDS
jgi:hypothetical protein